jgi:flagellar M-ring protein FliF
VTERQVTYDQDGSAIRSQQNNNQSMQGFRPIASGVAGAQSNTPLAPTPPTGTKTTDTKVDGKIVKSKNADGVVESKVEAWAPEKLKEFESIVASAVGLDKRRGDSLDIKNMEFTQTDFSEAEALLAAREKQAYVQSLLLYAGMGLVIVLFFFMVVRPFIKWITDNTSDGVETFLPQTLEELEKLQGINGLPGLEDAVAAMPEQVDPEKIESEMVKEKIVTLVDANPQKAALILKDWLILPAAGADKRTTEDLKDKGKSA